jgi:two-component system, NarL family, capsular synthesis sensor histidine kinase RcsC
MTNELLLFTKKNPLDAVILLVEDNPINVEVTLEQLSTIGIKNIDVAISGQLGLDAAKNKNYDIILMDISLSGVIDGIEATEKILEHYKFFKPKTSHPRIIALTANTMTETLNSASKAGMEKILLKPVRIDDLRTALGVAPPKPHLIIPSRSTLF